MNSLSRRLAPKRSLPVLVFLSSAAVMAVSLLTGLKPLPLHQLTAAGFFDLRIYRGSAEVVLAGRPLYAAKFQMGLGFTYPPAASLLFLALAAFPAHVDELLVTLLNIALVPVITRCSLHLRPAPVDATTRARERTTVWLTAALALWLEPVTSALGYGQIDLLIAALVLVDITRGHDRRGAGIGIGLAAALKLTPLIFLPYLALSGRPRMAWRALATFTGSILAAFALLPHDAAAYWGQALFDTSRVTGHSRFAGRGPANQSLRGALLRIAAGDPHLTVIWMASCLFIAGLGLLLAVRAARRGDQALGFTLTAVTGLLICPVSWTHHWCIAVPGVILLLSEPRTSPAGRLMTVATAAVALSTAAIWSLIVANPNGRNLDLGGLLLGDIYVLAGLGTIMVAGLLELRRVSRPGRVGVMLGAAARARPAIALSPGHPGEALRAMPSSQAATLDRESAR